MAKLGQILISRGWINLPQLTRALKTQSVVAGRLGTCLMEMDALSEEHLGKALAEQTGLPVATVEQLRAVPDEVIGVLPAKIARRCRAVPFQLIGNRLDIAMLDPRNLSCHDEVAFASGRRVRVHVAPEVRIFEALERYYSEECPSRFTLLLDRMNRARYLWKEEKNQEREADGANPAPPPFRNRERAPLGLDRFPDLPILGSEKTGGPLLDLPVAPPKPASGLFPLVRPVGSSGPPNPHGAAAPRAAERAERKPIEAPSTPTLPPARPKSAPPAAAATDRPAAKAPSVLSGPSGPSAPSVPAGPRLIPLTAEERADLERLEASAEETKAESKEKAGEKIESQTPPSLPPRREPQPALEPRVSPRPVPRPAPATLDELAEALAASVDRDRLADLVVEYLARRFDRAASFQVARGQVSGWRAQGKDVDAEAFAKYRVGLDQPSVFLNLERGSGLHLGPLPPMPAHRELAKCWGGDLPQRAMMLPIRIGERLVAVLYADGEDKSWNGFGIDVQNRLRDAFAGALEGCIRKRRGLRA